MRMKQGFTMIEILVVATIIIILTAISFVSFQGTAVRSRNSKREADIAQVRSALELYRSVNSSYPVYSSSGSGVSNFINVVNNSGTTGGSQGIRPYLSSASVTDPVNTGSYRYTYVSSASGATYSVCYYTEPSTTQVCLSNP